MLRPKLIRKSKTTFLILLLLGLVLTTVGVFFQPVRAQTWVEGHITQDTTWKVANSPYRAINDVIVDSGVLLTIEPGVEVQFADGFSLIVEGSLTAVGIDVNPIVLTSSRSSPSPGAWNTLRFKGNSSEQFLLVHVKVEHAVHGITVDNLGSATINKTEISKCSESGIMLSGQGNVVVEQSTIKQNRDGIFATGRFISDMCACSGMTLHNNSIRNNSDYGVHIDTSGDGKTPKISDFTIVGNIISENHKDGIFLHSHVAGGRVSSYIDKITVSNNSIMDNCGKGIHLHSYAHTKMDSGHCHAYIHSITITDNVIFSNADNGIFLYSYAYGWGNTFCAEKAEISGLNISGNKVFSNGGDGIYVYSRSLNGVLSWHTNISNVVISENDIVSNLGHGVLFFSDSGSANKADYAGIQNVTATRNSVLANKYDGICFRTAAAWGLKKERNRLFETVIAENTISSNGENGVALRSAHSDEVQFDVVLLNNTFCSNDNGLKVTGVTTNMSYSSLCHNKYGVFYGSSGNNAHYNDVFFNVYGTNVTNSATVNAEHNYWGHSTGPAHTSLNPEGEGNAVNGDGTDLDFIPFLSSPVGTINQLSVAVLEVDKTNPNVDETVTFDASRSTDDGKIDYYFFDFGDGANSSWTPLSVVTHKYASEGIYNATLIVMDDFGVTSNNLAMAIIVCIHAVKPFYVEDSFSETSSLEYWLGYFIDEGVFVDSDITVRMGNDSEVSKVELVYTVHYENNPTSKRFVLTKSSGDEYQGNIKETDEVSVIMTILNKLLLTFTPYPGIPLEFHPRFWNDFPKVTADRLEVTTPTKMYTFEIDEELTVAKFNEFPSGEYVWVACNVDVLITDEQGRRLGSIYEEGVYMGEINEIPGSTCSGHGYPTFAYTPYNIATIEVIGEEEGNYSLYLVEIVDGETGDYLSKKNASTTTYYRERYRVEDNFIPQCYLTVHSEYGDPEGEGWYDEGTTASFSVTSPAGFIIQQVFAVWGGDVSATTPSATVVMGSHKTVVASWSTDYTQLLVIIAILAVIVIGVSIVSRRGKKTKSSA